MAAIREHITRDGDNRYTATVRRKGSNRASYSKTFDTRKAAEDWAANEERQIKEQRRAGGVHQVRTVRDAIQRYREDHDIKPTLKTDDKHVLDWWSSRLGDKRLSLTPVDDGCALREGDFLGVVKFKSDEVHRIPLDIPTTELLRSHPDDRERSL